MAWCHQATSHYLSQCWPRPLSPYGVTRPQWVKMTYLDYRSSQLTHLIDIINIIFFNSLWPSDAIWWHRSRSTLAQVMAWWLTTTKPLPQPILTYHKWSFVVFTWQQIYWRHSRYELRNFENYTLKIRATSWVKHDSIGVQWNCPGFMDFITNTLRPRQNGRHFPDAIFKYIFSNKNISISIKKFTEVCSQGSN